MSPHHDLPLLVAYDIADHRRRTRLHRLLSGFGEPIQKSVFVCWLNHARQGRLRRLLERFQGEPHDGDEAITCVVVNNYPKPNIQGAQVVE